MNNPRIGLDAVIAVMVVGFMYVMLVRALDADTQIPTEPDDPAYIKTLPELIGDPCDTIVVNKYAPSRCL